MDEGLQALATLAEHVVSRGQQSCFSLQGTPVARNHGLLPKEWTRCFQEAEVFQDKLSTMNGRGRDTWVGIFLSGKTNQKVAISLPQGNATAVLRKNLVRNDQKRYYFEIFLQPTTDAPQAGQAVVEEALE